MGFLNGLAAVLSEAMALSADNRSRNRNLTSEQREEASLASVTLRNFSDTLKYYDD